MLLFMTDYFQQTWSFQSFHTVASESLWWIIRFFLGCLLAGNLKQHAFAKEEGELKSLFKRMNESLAFDFFVHFSAVCYDEIYFCAETTMAHGITSKFVSISPRRPLPRYSF